jgi:hypothetical protein
MSWNKYNVYNVHQMKPIRAKKFPLNLLSLRFHAKRAARKYHGQGLSERIFKRQLYNPMINVVASPPGAENGKLLIWGGLFQGVERRFDNVIFRSLFASSIQQARQMIVHGHVELNGKIVSLYNDPFLSNLSPIPSSNPFLQSLPFISWIPIDTRNIDRDCYCGLATFTMPIRKWSKSTFQIISTSTSRTSTPAAEKN